MPPQAESKTESNTSPTLPTAAIEEAVILESASPSSAPPDGGYGWVCLACIATVNSFTWGIAASYGVYLAYYLSEDIYPEATAFDFALVGGLNFGGAMLSATPATIAVRLWGIHVPMLMGIGFQVAGFVAASFTTRLWQLYLSQGVLVGLGIGFTWVPSNPVTSQWFDKRRSLANGITSAGSGVGGVIFSFAIRAIIQNISLAWALRITGIVPGVCNLVATALLRSRNKEIKPTLRGFDFRMFRSSPVLLLLSWGFTSLLGYICVLYSLSDFARSIGLSTSEAASVTAILNAGTMVGRPIIGVLSDRYGRFEVAGLCTLANAVFIFAFWIPAQSYALLIVFAIFAGVTIGIFWSTVSPLCAEVVGLKHLPSLLSLCWAIVALPTTFSEVIALKIRQPGSAREYLYPQIYAGLTYIVSAAILFKLWRMTDKLPLSH